VLVGAGIGFGWHYFANSAGGRAVAAAVTPPVQHDARNRPSSNPPAPPDCPVLDGTDFQIYQRDNQFGKPTQRVH
jgi:hypothetical protein